MDAGCFFSTALGRLMSYENPKNKVTAVYAKEEEICGATFMVFHRMIYHWNNSFMQSCLLNHANCSTNVNFRWKEHQFLQLCIRERTCGCENSPRPRLAPCTKFEIFSLNKNQLVYILYVCAVMACCVDFFLLYFPWTKSMVVLSSIVTSDLKI